MTTSKQGVGFEFPFGSTSTFTWMATVIPLEPGYNKIRITVTTPSGSSGRAFITVERTTTSGQNPPDPPADVALIALADSATTRMNAFIDIDVLANDSDAEGDLISVASVTPSPGGTVSINPNGTVHFVPAADFTGHCTFTYSITDGHGHIASGVVTVLVAYPAGFPNERVSISTTGTQGNQDSWMGAISGGGRFVAFYTSANNLAPEAPPGSILIHDRLTKETSAVSCDSSGVAQGSSEQPAVSSDGRYIAFMSGATSLVPGDVNSRGDIFLRDRQTGTTTLVSVNSVGGQANGTSFAPSISADGQHIAYFSNASNIVPGDINGTGGDIFVYDRQINRTVLASIGPAGTQIGSFADPPSLSADGRFVAFSSGGQIYVRDLVSALTTLVSATPRGSPGNGVSDRLALSASGRYVAFSSLATDLVPGDGNGFKDVFVRDLQTGQTVRVTVATDGTEANGSVPDYTRPAISGNGRFVSFVSAASNLASGDTGGHWDVFVHDLQTAQTARVSMTAAGVEANGVSGDSVMVSMSSDGQYVTFSSAASNLVAGDSNGWMDVFVAPNPLVP